LVDVVAYVWQSRWLVLGLTGTAVAIGVALMALFPSYSSEGLFQFGGAISDPRITDYSKTLGEEPPAGVSLPDYRRYSAVYLTEKRFAEFVQRHGLADNAAAKEIRKAFDTGDIVRMLQPIGPDGKPLDQAKDTSGNVTGLRISARTSSPAIAQEMVGLLARYIVDSIVHALFSTAVPVQYARLRTALVLYDKMLLANAIKLEELKRKSTSLRDILGRYPGAANVVPRQMVSPSPQSGFFSPLDLLVTAEVDAIEARAERRRLQRERAQTTILMEYLERVRTLLAEAPTSKQVLEGMAAVREDMLQTLQDDSLDDEAIREAYNTIKIANQRSTDVFFEKSGFIVGPTLPARSTSRPLVGSMLALVLGLVCSFLLVFAMQWWRANRTTIHRSR